MAVYRFRVTFEDHEEVFREIEIKSLQNFEDFHNSIINAIDFPNGENASFFISDDYWRKGEEICLQENTNKDVKQRIMKKCKIVSLIDDPHQKFLYIFGNQGNWPFMVELLKIVPDDPKATYPRCAKSEGIAPKNIPLPIIPVDLLDEEEDFEDEPENDALAYDDSHAEDEVAELEGEEGDFDEEEEIGELEIDPDED